MSVTSIGRTQQHDDPPQDVGAEQALLGACMRSSEAAAVILERLQVQHLYRPPHQVLYQLIGEMSDNGEATDPITVHAQLQLRGQVERVGGASYLHTIYESVPTLAEGSLRKWVDQVRYCAALRKVGELSGSFHALANTRAETREEFTELLERAQEQLADATEWITDDAEDDATDLGGHLDRVLATIHDRAVNGVTSGVRTGFQDLDEVTNGLHPGQLVVIGGRPGIGKSTLAVDMARHAAISQDVPSLVLSMEMDADEVTERVLAAEARIRLADLRRGTLQPADFQRLQQTVPRLQQAPLHISDISGATITALRAQARKMVHQHGIKLLVIDYLQLIESQGRAENRQIEVSGFSRKLKLLAKELDIPVVVAAQLNRGPEARGDHKPQMSDLRESGGIENDADLVVLVHRPDAYERDDPRMSEADLIVPKHRAGPTTTVTIAHQLHYSRFCDMDQDPGEAASAAAGVPQHAPAAAVSDRCQGCRQPIHDDQERTGSWHADCRHDREQMEQEELGLAD